MSIEGFLVKEQAVLIEGPAGQLEVAVHSGDVAGALAARQWLVVICHPHPQHGGTMDNKVVTTLMRAYRDLGIQAIRLNFRGVGNSGGTFANAIGEQDDLLAVLQWVTHTWPQKRLLLAGFSFGSSIAAQVSYQSIFQHLTLIAPPIERYPYDREKTFHCPVCVVQGGQDERVNAEGVLAWGKSLHNPVELIYYPDAGHFFHGYLTQLKNDLTSTLLRQLE